MTVRHTQEHEDDALKVRTKDALDWVFRGVSSIGLMLLVWMITLLISVDKRVAVMEGNRFTAADGLKLQQDILDLKDDMPVEWKNRIISLEQCQIKIRMNRSSEC